MNPLLTSTESFTLDLLILVYPIYNFRNCMTGIFVLVTGDDIICDSCPLDILPSSIHNLLEFSLSDPSRMPCEMVEENDIDIQYIRSK